MLEAFISVFFFFFLKNFPLKNLQNFKILKKGVFENNKFYLIFFILNFFFFFYFFLIR